MKKIYTLLITSIFVISCSQSNTYQENQKTPIVEYVWHSAGPDFNAENLAKLINEWNAIITDSWNGMWVQIY